MFIISPSAERTKGLGGAVLKMISDSILQIFGLPHLHMNKINGLLYSFIILVAFSFHTRNAFQILPH